MAEKLRTLDFGDGKGARVLVPDWENVENKPFGEMVMTLVDNQTITLDEGQGVIGQDVELLAGREYTVIYNGTEYKSTAVAMSDGENTTIFMGNFSMLGGDDTGEPFIIAYMTSTAMTMIMAFDGSTEVVLTIIGSGIKIIDKEYLPPISTIKYLYYSKTDSIYYLYKDPTYTEKVTKDYLKYLVEENTIIMVKNGSRRDIIASIWLNDYDEFGAVYVCNPYELTDGTIEIRAIEAYTAEYTG